MYETHSWCDSQESADRYQPGRQPRCSCHNAITSPLFLLFPYLDSTHSKQTNAYGMLYFVYQILKSDYTLVHDV